MILEQGRIIEFDRYAKLSVDDDEKTNPIMFSGLPRC